jgi:LPS sulfotransferase NodH
VSTLRARPDLAYLVCATPRSGSTLLCETLRATGRAGVPLEHFEVRRATGLPRQPREYFTGVRDPSVLDPLAPLRRGSPDVEAPEAWSARIVAEGLTPNGVWGGKLMWGHVDDVLARARRLDGLAGADLGDVLGALLGEVRPIFVTRPDKVAQAVSLWRAVQTQSWRAGTPARATRASGTREPAAHDEPVYSFAAIDHLVGRLEADDAAWRAWFAARGTAPLVVVYDDLEADPAGTAATVLRALGLDDGGVRAPGVERQADERSARWAARYRDERAAA